MTEFRYALIRFIPDMERMEPINVGVILQGQGSIDFKLSPHTAKRTDVDTQVFQRWRAFLEEEIRGEAVPFLQPPKDSVQFLHYLSGLCEQTVLITKPLVLAAQPDESFGQVLESLYERLVAPVKPLKKHPERPTSQFREIEEEKQFRKRGMKKHPYLSMDGNRRWNAFRQVINGENIVIDKVEVGNLVGLTADEIQKLSSGGEEFLTWFLSDRPQSLPPRYFLIADELREKFTDQTDEDFQAMKEEYAKVLMAVNKRGGKILRKREDIVDFALELDQKMPQLEELKAKPKYLYA